MADSSRSTGASGSVDETIQAFIDKWAPTVVERTGIGKLLEPIVDFFDGKSSTPSGGASGPDQGSLAPTQEETVEISRKSKVQELEAQITSLKARDHRTEPGPMKEAIAKFIGQLEAQVKEMTQVSQKDK